jgi:hypothetical protein
VAGDQLEHLPVIVEQHSAVAILSRKSSPLITLPVEQLAAVGFPRPFPTPNGRTARISSRQ